MFLHIKAFLQDFLFLINFSAGFGFYAIFFGYFLMAFCLNILTKYSHAFKFDTVTSFFLHIEAFFERVMKSSVNVIEFFQFCYFFLLM